MPVNHLWGLLSGEGVYTNSKFSETFESCGKSYIDNSLCYGGKVFNSVIIDSCTQYYPVIVKSSLLNSYISGVSVSVESALENAVLAGSSVVRKAVILDSEIIGDVRVLGNSKCCKVENCKLFGSVVIRDGASLEGVELGGWAIIDRGHWTRPPLCFTTSTGLIITESIDDLVKINCITNSTAKWLGGAGERLGKKLGMTFDEIEEVRYYMRLIRDCKEGLCC